MIIENCRTLGLLPKFSRLLNHKPSGINKFFSAVANENPENSSTDISESSENKIAKANEESNKLQFKSLRYKFPEFLPKSNVKWRNAIKEKLERRDMLRRRGVINIPEFYVGSVLSVTSSNKHATGKLTKFVGICIFRQDDGLYTEFVLRNVIDHQGVEVKYSLYSPLIQNIEVLRLEKRLDENLYYLRDAPHEFSTFPLDMVKEYGKEEEVPLNTMKVPLNPKPWLARYEIMDLKGAILPELSEKVKRRALKSAAPWKKYDLMDEYRKTIPEEEQKDIFLEICDQLEKLEVKGKQEKKKKVFSKPTKQKLF